MRIGHPQLNTQALTSGGSVELTESLEEESLLLVVGEGQSLESLGGVLGSLFDGDVGNGVLGRFPLILNNSRSVFAGS